jgi:5-methylcytosine-specific restriction endonuclease McrA
MGTWNAALKAAGLETAVFNAVPVEELMQSFAELWRQLGRQPTAADFDRGYGRYSKTPYFKRYKTFGNLLAHFAAWAGVKATVVRSRTNFRPAEPQPPIRQTSRKPTSRQQIQVLMRDGATCRICGARPENGATLEVDHIIPWSKGGETVLENLQVLCKHCNRTKHNLTDDQAEQTHPNESPGGAIECSHGCSGAPAQADRRATRGKKNGSHALAPEGNAVKDFYGEKLGFS